MLTRRELLVGILFAPLIKLFHKREKEYEFEKSATLTIPELTQKEIDELLIKKYPMHYAYDIWDEQYKFAP